ncbi:adhesion G protein-coupled receptor L4-like [Hydractinia symbiolongicarpus]|uniref:adhesion G protein-coupled receptor L4-like n=1 Tax=Hydractinia symbiolongicarpus TaxID=13093 RepID=UPI002550E759|nr:adhesion G protein-coupled receptor L4-like [Hydractinia symbiolongicarpus]
MLLEINKLLHKICKISAIFLHWLWLTAHLWTFIVAYDMQRRFGGTFASSVCHKGKVLWYSMMTYFSSTRIVSICLLLEYIGKQNMEYGTSGICWINNTLSRVVAYIAPVLLLQITTMFLLSVSIFRLKKNLKQSSNALNKTRQLSLVKMTIKLFLGFAELLV